MKPEEGKEKEKRNELKFRYEFDRQSSILYKYYYGPTDMKMIAGSWDYAIENQLIPAETKGFIIDYRQASVQIELSNYSAIPAYYKAHPEHFEGKKVAVIVNTPKDIIVPLMIRRKIADFDTQTFSTTEAAVAWILGIPHIGNRR
jgi:hypothetical protein